MTQTIEYVVKVNATQAQAAVADVEKRFGGVDTVVARVDKSIIALERDMKDLNAAIAAGGPNVAHYRKELDRLSSSISGGESAGGGSVAGGSRRNLGQAALEGSRALEDLQYGIGGVVNNIPSLVMALGGGAGLTAAISVAAVGVHQLIKNFSGVGDAGKAGADAAASHMEDLKKAIQDADTEMQDLILGASMGRIQAQKMAVEEAANAGKQAQTTFRSQFGIDPNDQRAMGMIASQAQGGLDTWITRWNAQKQEMEKVRVAAKDVMSEYRKVTDAYNLAIEQQVLLRRYESIEAERIEQIKTDAAVDAANAQEEAYKASQDKKTKDAKKQAEDEAKLRYDLHVAMLDDEDKALEAVRKSRAEDRKKEVDAMAKEFRDMDRERANRERNEKKALRERERNEKKALREREHAEQLHQSRLEQLEGESLAARMAFDTVAMNHKMENLDKLKAHEFKNLKDNVKQYESMYNDIGQLAQGATTTLINVSEDYFKAKIEGAENAEQLAAAAFLAATGDQLVGIGTKYLFEGAGMSILGDPRGPAMLGLGGLAVAAGVGMGAGSAALSHTAAGGTIGKPLDDKQSTRDPGASPRSSGGGGSGGPLIVNVAYGAGGPLPEDIAREIHKVTSSGNRRRGAA